MSFKRGDISTWILPSRDVVFVGGRARKQEGPMWNPAMRARSFLGSVQGWPGQEQSEQEVTDGKAKGQAEPACRPRIRRGR